MNASVHECRGLNITLDPEKITEVDHAEMAEMFKRVTGAAHAHVFHHQLRADRRNAHDNGFNTSPAPRPYVTCFFPLAAKHPADIDNVPYRWCPLRASTALQSVVLVFCACFFSPKSTGHRHFVVFFT